MKNLFFDKSELKFCGENVIIGKTVRIRYPHLVELQDNVIIDDFCYISTALNMKSNTHISSGCKIIGGKDSLVSFDEFSTLAPGVVLSAGTDDYLNGIATPMVPMEFKSNAVIGEIHLGKHCIVGSNSVVLPNVKFNEGACLGALSLANKDLDAYYLYAGVPCKKLKARDKDSITKLEKDFKLGQK